MTLLGTRFWEFDNDSKMSQHKGAGGQTAVWSPSVGDICEQQGTSGTNVYLADCWDKNALPHKNCQSEHAEFQNKKFQ